MLDLWSDCLSGHSGQAARISCQYRDSVCKPFVRSKLIIRKRYDQPCREVGPHDFSLLCDMTLQNDVYSGKAL